MRLGLIAPTEESAYQAFIGSGAPPRHYPPFNSLVYSLENFLPVVDLHQGTYWRPNPHHPSKRTRKRQMGGRYSLSPFAAMLFMGPYPRRMDDHPAAVRRLGRPFAQRLRAVTVGLLRSHLLNKSESGRNLAIAWIVGLSSAQGSS